LPFRCASACAEAPHRPGPGPCKRRTDPGHRQPGAGRPNPDWRQHILCNHL